MNPNANKAFVAELANNAENNTRSTVHGRAWVLGKWEVVHTPAWIGPAGSLCHGSTRVGLIDDESLTWGGERLVMRLLPIVDHGGGLNPYPGDLATGGASGVASGKDHILGHALSGQKIRHDGRSWCGVPVSWARSQGDASWVMRRANTCRRCTRKAKEFFAGL